MEDYLEFDKNTKALKSIDLDSFSVEELEEYINQLTIEIQRVNKELGKKLKLQDEANQYFK
tara:strand:- start:1185 stop:1367 length:183 start_codon:yes stop_codon:yes gene_type:complete